eukprot:scaffold18738_cov25-Prasinocladus_malaysianus.AAC.2
MPEGSPPRAAFSLIEQCNDTSPLDHLDVLSDSDSEAFKETINDNGGGVDNDSTTAATLNPLKKQTWANRKDAISTLQAAATIEGKQVLVDTKQMGGSNVTLRCATRLSKGQLVVPDDQPSGQYLCPYKAQLARSHHKNKDKPQVWKLTKGSLLEHRNCNGLAKPKARELLHSTTIVSTVASNRGVQAKDVQRQLTTRDGVQPPTHTLYRVKNHILHDDDRNYAADFQRIAPWCEAWEANGNGKTLLLLDKDKFQAVAVCCKAPAKRAMGGMHTFAVDGAHFKHRLYRGTLLVVECVDGDNKNILVAFMICPCENHYFYSQLFKFLKECTVDGKCFGDWIESDQAC